MKTPEEIKIGLGCMINSDIECDACPYRDDNYLFCSTGIVKDAIACIQQLEYDKNWASENYKLILQQLERDKNWASENYDLIREENKRLEAQVPKWISVEERLPEDDVFVLVYAIGNNESSCVAMTSYTHHMHGYDIEGWRPPWQYFFYEREITHWMPMPEPPKEDSNA